MFTSALTVVSVLAPQCHLARVFPLPYYYQTDMGRNLSGMTDLNLPRIHFAGIKSSTERKMILTNTHERAPSDWITDDTLSLTFDVNVNPTCGLDNAGNTCYLASAIQCLFHVPPFVHLLREHAPSGRNSRFCGHCALTEMYNRMTDSARPRAIRPYLLSQHVNQLSCQLRPGRMEDAHEFLSALLVSYTRATVLGCLRGASPATVLSPELELRSPIRRVFGGMMQSSITCSKCSYISSRDELFTELPLDIHRRTVQQALTEFTAVEHLTSANKYHCSRCMQKVCATKRFDIIKAPNALVLVLKRFNGSGKSNKFIEYPAALNLKQYMRNAPEDVNYRLTGVLVHAGDSCRSGHYFAFVKTPNGVWKRKDDGRQKLVSAKVAMSQKAYILFYTRVKQQLRICRLLAPEQSSFQETGILSGEPDGSDATDTGLHSRSSSPPSSNVPVAANLQFPVLPASTPSVIAEKSNLPEGATLGKVSTYKESSAVKLGVIVQSEESPEMRGCDESKHGELCDFDEYTSSSSLTGKIVENIPVVVSGLRSLMVVGVTTAKRAVYRAFKVAPLSALAMSPVIQIMQTTNGKGNTTRTTDGADNGVFSSRAYRRDTAEATRPEPVYSGRPEDHEEAVRLYFRQDNDQKQQRIEESKTFVQEGHKVEAENAEQSRSGKMSKLFGNKGVALWEDESDDRQEPGKVRQVEKRRRANDELDTKYDEGRPKKVRRKLIHSSTFKDFADTNMSAKLNCQVSVS